jgi:acyl-CoA reductase-like NAD-dependent aldehyde dehydrogenase
MGGKIAAFMLDADCAVVRRAVRSAGRAAMAAKVLLFHNEAREKIRAGLNTLASAVRVTLGPKGRLVMLERAQG